MRRFLPFLLIGVTTLALAQSTVGTPYPSSPKIMVTKVQGQPAKLTWSAVTTYTDGSAIPSTVAVTYDVYEALPGGTFQPTATALTALTYTTAPLTAGTPCWEIDSYANGLYSGSSNAGCAQVSLPPPSAPTLQSIQ